MDLINFRESDKKIKMPYRVLFKKKKHLNLEHQECWYSRPAARVWKYKDMTATDKKGH